MLYLDIDFNMLLVRTFASVSSNHILIELNLGKAIADSNAKTATTTTNSIREKPSTSFLAKILKNRKKI